MEKDREDFILLFLYALQELIESGNLDGAKKVVSKAIERSERKEEKTTEWSILVRK